LRIVFCEEGWKYEVGNVASDISSVRGDGNRHGYASLIAPDIDSQDEVVGWTELKSMPSPEDLDGDGMLDRWEKSHDLDPATPSAPSAAPSDPDKDGYTDIEKYLNQTDQRAAD
jgi:hypothetical protein